MDTSGLWLLGTFVPARKSPSTTDTIWNPTESTRAIAERSRVWATLWRRSFFRTCLLNQFHKILEHSKTDLLALLGMELGCKHIFPPDGRGETLTILSPGSHEGRILGTREEAVDEIDIAAIGNA